MANESVLTQEDFQRLMQQYHDEYVYPYQGGATHTGCVPLGTILPYFGETAPNHFLICDGSTYDKNDYPELAAHLLSLTNTTPYVIDGDDTKFKVPDLRGEFLRGSGTNGHANQGNGADVGVHQNGTIINQQISDTSGLLFSSYNSSYNQCLVENEDKIISTSNKVMCQSNAIAADWTLANVTTRPTNTSVTYIIAYRNAYIDLALDSFPIEMSNPQDGQLLMYDATAGRWVNGGHKYSTEEHIVGTWIDGKPIYEKTIELTVPIATTDGTEVSSDIDTEVSIDAIIEINGLIVNMNTSGNVYYTIPMCKPSGEKIIRIQCRDNTHSTKPNSLGIFNSDTTIKNAIAKVQLRYTKTT